MQAKLIIDMKGKKTRILNSKVRDILHSLFLLN